ncbi:cytochrome c oxidase polypeptide 5, mitochondrial [Aspergillus sclerotioniger CBS 115572]|uniref:Cytochrome c oxidase polypeptide V n=1 Tax=Aspergillus sclerotioniger CBS 115572 TaxID=1450535 RepID=A0A317X688_9EURO|nr:cytochrome c oxidase polypeptide 5, mitochondrial [Aspergillus sclerotioniger CBS 115572]PWY94093.1 cytochrome c oxidase polypeptide 5, mitochondrial [Aspergillus sclerotioniger CBS 115572]
MFLRSVTRAAARSSAMPTTALRSYRAVPGPMACMNARPQTEKKSIAPQQTRAASEHAISNPTLAGIEKRWEAMPPQEQADLWMQLRDRMKVDWHQMTLQEKKAAYWISFGPHGPRTLPPKGENLKIFVKVVQLTLVSFGIFYVIHLFAKPQPKTMSKEWQEASNEYALQEKINPIYGISSEGYEGKGFVQSPPAEKQ